MKLFSKRGRPPRTRNLSLERCERRNLLATVELLPVADNTLFEDDLGSLSNGAGAYLFAGKVAPFGSEKLRRGLIRFDLAQQVPVNATINSVSLELNMSRTIVGDEPVALHTVLASWGEGASDAPRQEGTGTSAQVDDATWLHRNFPSTAWAAAGGDFTPEASSTIQVGGNGRYTWSSEQLTADVTNWLADPTSNFGWMILGNESAPTTAKRFDTRENVVESNRPKLVIDFDVVDTTRPTPTITGLSDPTLANPFDVTIAFDEVVTGFTLADVTVVGGSVTNLVDDGNGIFTASIDAPADGTVTVDVAADVATDAAGNNNVAATQFSITVAASLDFGDAPTAAQSGFANSYPVTLGQDGARHSAGALVLGDLIDVERDGQPTTDAGGDGADEDGVAFVTSVVVSQVSTTSSLKVSSSLSGKLDAWIDFNRDGDWDDSGEQILLGVNVVAGENVLSLSVPANASVGDTGIRLRLSSAGGLAPTGAAADGEVEDYLVTLLDGDAAPEAVVEMVGGSLTLSTEQGDTLLRFGQTDRFRAPSSNVGSLRILGAEGDDTLTLELGAGFQLPAGGLKIFGGAGDNTLVINGAGESIDLGDPAIDANDLNKIDLSAVDQTTLTIDAAVVAKLDPVGKLVEIVASVGDKIVVRNAPNWRMTDPIVVDDQFQVTATNQESGGEKIQALIPHAWQNLLVPSDVTNDGVVTARDALVIINELGRNLFSLPNGDMLDPIGIQAWPGVYYDQNGDDRASALDALRVINLLALQPPSGSSGEGELILLSSGDSRSEVKSAPTPRDDRAAGALQPKTSRLVTSIAATETTIAESEVDSPPKDQSGNALSISNVDQLLSAWSGATLSPSSAGSLSFA